MNKWTERYLDMAESFGQWSKDPSTKIGAICVGSSGQILSQGYNGFPRGFSDTKARLNNREEKYKFTIHGEMNCIYNAGLNGVSLKDAHLYVTGLPVCSKCALGVSQVGITKVIMRHPINIPEKWALEYQDTKIVFKASRIQATRFDENGNIIND